MQNQYKTDLDKALNKLAAQDKSCSQELTALKLECKSLRDELDGHIANLDRKSRELCRAVEEREALEQERETEAVAFGQKERKLQQEVRELRDNLWRLQQQADAQHIENQKHGQELSSALQQKAHLEESISQLRVALDDRQRGFSSESRKLQDDVLSLQQVTDKQHTALERKEQELVSLRNELSLLKVSIRIRIVC